MGWTSRDASHPPNPQAIMNGGVNGMESEQYPPVPTLFRNETPPYPRLIATDCLNGHS